VRPRLAAAAKKLSATYEFSYMKHAPIGPTMAVADALVRTGRCTSTRTTKIPRRCAAKSRQMLGVSPDRNVVVRTFSGPGHYGRSNGGNAGAEDEAVILSQAVGKPVRVQWMRPEDFQWSTQSPAAFSDVANRTRRERQDGRVSGRPLHARRQDDRPVGAVLAGLPTMPAPDEKAPPAIHRLDGQRSFRSLGLRRRRDLMERGHGTFQVGQKASPLAVGLRDHSMRTPGQFQQNFPRELAISEAAALAGADAIQFRIDHTKEERVDRRAQGGPRRVGMGDAPSPHAKPVSTGDAPVRGRGVSVMFRSGTYWACVCEIAVTPSTGAIAVEKYTIAVDPGIVVNPMQLKRQVEGGAVMGISHALLEEATFDESGITARDWRTYPILKMADIPEIKVVLLTGRRSAATAADRRRRMPWLRPRSPRRSSMPPGRLPGAFR
jgi:nicotinate dehydrogenase subunit B